MYALFSVRKMMLISRISMFNQRLMNLAQQQMDLAQLGANIHDGLVTPEEWAQSPVSIIPAQHCWSPQMMARAHEMAVVQAGILQEKYHYQVKPEALRGSFLAEMGKAFSKKIAVAENKIAMEKTKLETQLKAAQQELEQLDKVEDQAIKNATPKYV